jgi:UDP-N-acetylmuramyl pentapeptide phosphotransferase/UDP-N-acetylglucosamine-1-phosphate transferase
MYLAILTLISGFLISYLLMPNIIYLAIRKNLFTTLKPVLKGGELRKISNLGGIAIFVALRITHSLFIDLENFPSNYYTAALFIIFLVGLNDDLTGMKPLNRLIAQITVALIIVIPGQLYIHSLDGMFGIYELNPLLAMFLSAFFIVGLINAFNLIDGLDGLAGSLALLIMLVFAYLFHLLHRTDLALLSLAFSGTLIAFLVYNLHPAKIFMGDSGAYIIGFTMGVFAIELLNGVSQNSIQIQGITLHSAYGLVLALLFIPIFDTVRVFTLRLSNKQHPFKGDNNHIHHRLLKMGFRHTQIAAIFVLTTLVLALFSILLKGFNPTIQVLILLGIVLLLNQLSYWFSKKNYTLSQIKNRL